MSTTDFIVAGPGTDAASHARTKAAASDIAAALEAAEVADISPSRNDETANVDRRVIDPVAVAALVVSIPGAILAVTDLTNRIADRIEKMRRARAAIARAKELRASQSIEVQVIVLGAPARPLADLDAADLLDLAAKREP